MVDAGPRRESFEVSVLNIHVFLFTKVQVDSSDRGKCVESSDREIGKCVQSVEKAHNFKVRRPIPSSKFVAQLNWIVVEGCPSQACRSLADLPNITLPVSILFDMLCW